MKSDLGPLNDGSKQCREPPSCLSRAPGVKRLAALSLSLLALSASLAAGPAAAQSAPLNADPPSCQAVRFADVGWTDVTSTTALASELLRSIGYLPQTTVLSVPVTFASMQNKDIDVFLGNWMPTQEADRAKYIADGSVVELDANLTGAKYTLAVPAYAYEAGLHDFADIHRFGAALNNSIYGIEPGNDGNRTVLKMLSENFDNLGEFKLVESSEQGMLAQVERAVRAKQPIVFLAWEPHPMNMRFDLRYLSGGDTVFGPNFGGATIYTVTRKGYVAECPNVGRLLKNLKFTLRGESEMMEAILDRHEQPQSAAAAWLKANPDAVKSWLDGVLTFDGHPAAAARSNAAPTVAPTGFEQWIVSSQDSRRRHDGGRHRRDQAAWPLSV